MSSCTGNNGGNQYTVAYNLTGLMPGAIYQFTVNGSNAGSSFTSSKSFTTMSAPFVAPTTTSTNSDTKTAINSTSSDTKTAITSTSSDTKTAISSIILDTNTATTTPTPTPTPTPTTDDTYERICSSLNWTSCGQWTIYDVNGNQLNRVVGPTGLSALIAIGCQNSGVNLCMDNKGNPATGYAVLNGNYQPGKYIPISLPSPQSSSTTASTPTSLQNTSNSSETKTVMTFPETKTVTTTPQPVQSGLGGYAVVHPNGKVCGVIVATSADPFANGGTMPIEYMGCPIGSRIIFQTTASSSGNVTGWHGENVTYNGNEFEIKSGTLNSEKVQTKIQGGVATDSDGRVWDTGSGAVLKPATVTTTTTITGPTNSIAPQTLSIKVSIPDLVTVNQVLSSLETSEKESQLVTKITSSKNSSVSINTEFSNSLLQFTATKKGFKTITVAVLTNNNGDAKLSIKRSLSGFTVSLKAGAKSLDQDKVGNK
ncbi:MAG: hypothetical protein F2651_00445 [Actinobacteria bacterium]|nr:hypothetical protein [Actinomycetota bacterium]MSV70337.1 hypothetical protein [Actinomycetota bacterium]MSW14038.1 hypothetical protein [Actinomycetota bacterium]MSX46978.1 hypothetical protein [Actinomycetota bacterium]MSX91385.1 hypothetical protein [Actinomycetota bacterium]